MKNARVTLGLLGSAIAAYRAICQVRAARGSKDRLVLANAVANVAVVLTGGVIAARELAKDKTK
ncbi:MAG: hypothetical protein ACRDQ1_05775 [Sciscionella sp.]